MTFALAGCATASRVAPGGDSARTIATPTPAPTPDLSGDWISGSGAEPGDPVVRVTRPCGRTVTAWRIYQEEDRIGAVLVLGTALTGFPHALPVGETASGTVRGAEVELEAIPGLHAPATFPYRLTVEENPRRLRGTRDGAPVWFAPLEVESPADCRDPLATPVVFDLSGAWMLGAGRPEPADPVLTEYRNCANHPARWVLDQRGEAVEAWSFPETFDQGIVRRDPPARISPDAVGRVQGYDLVLEGAESRYRLRYDPESGHLRGTRDGIAVWGVRRQFVTPGPCPPVP